MRLADCGLHVIICILQPHVYVAGLRGNLRHPLALRHPLSHVHPKLHHDHFYGLVVKHSNNCVQRSLGPV